MTAHFISTTWPSDVDNGTALRLFPIRSFVEEVLRRSRTSYVTLNVSLFYLCKASRIASVQQGLPEKDASCTSYLRTYRQCGRRMFLASLILASKYLQDRAYTNRAWSKISGLNAREITRCEMTLLVWLGWKLYISAPVFAKWQLGILRRIRSSKPQEDCCTCIFPGWEDKKRTYSQSDEELRHLPPSSSLINGKIPTPPGSAIRLMAVITDAAGSTEKNSEPVMMMNFREDKWPGNVTPFDSPRVDEGKATRPIKRARVQQNLE